MKKMIKIANFAIIAVTFAVLAAFPTTTRASHQWGTYHWARTSNPFTLKVGNNVTSNWSSDFNTSVSDWSQSSVMNLSAISGTAGKRCTMVVGTIQVCNNRYGSNGWLGLASINITGGDHITQGSAKMNDTYFNTSTYNNPNERLHVMCQEVGHTFGLGHTSEDGSSQNTCMDYFSNTGANAGSILSTRPNQHDYDLLGTMYAHLDPTTTIGFTASSPGNSGNANAGSNENPNDWGMLMRQSANGRSSTYEKDLGNGNSMITHVFWTEERAENCPGCDHRFHE